MPRREVRRPADARKKKTRKTVVLAPPGGLSISSALADWVASSCQPPEQAENPFSIDY
jgi:hypothetical protein